MSILVNYSDSENEDSMETTNEGQLEFGKEEFRCQKLSICKGNLSPKTTTNSSLNEQLEETVIIEPICKPIYLATNAVTDRPTGHTSDITEAISDQISSTNAVDRLPTSAQGKLISDILDITHAVTTKIFSSSDPNCPIDVGSIESGVITQFTNSVAGNMDLEDAVASENLVIKQKQLDRIHDSRPSNPSNKANSHIICVDYRINVHIKSESEDSDSDSSQSVLIKSSDSETEENSSVGETVIGKRNRNFTKKKKNMGEDGVPKTRGELDLCDLPAIKDLHITVPMELTQLIGKVFKIVEQQVVVQALPNIPPIDLESVLFLDHGKTALGRIFDVFGPVQEPLYVVRFNSLEHVMQRAINIGAEVFFAPSTEHTNFIVLDQLMRWRGSDASWYNDNEPPVSCLDYSDDEQERAARKGHKKDKQTAESTDVPKHELESNSKRIRGKDFPQEPSTLLCGMHTPPPTRPWRQFHPHTRTPMPNPAFPQESSNPFCGTHTPPPTRSWRQFHPHTRTPMPNPAFQRPPPFRPPAWGVPPSRLVRFGAPPKFPHWNRLSHLPPPCPFPPRASHNASQPPPISPPDYMTRFDTSRLPPDLLLPPGN